MIDFHVHLDLYSDPLSIAKECNARGIYVLSVTTTPSAWERTLALTTSTSRIRTARGLHPQVAHQRKGELDVFNTYLAETKYIGEIGLDGSPEYRVHWDDQLLVFDHILHACADAGGRIMSIHSRRATQAVLEKLEAVRDSGVPVLHWFSGSKSDLDQAIALNCWFSVGPAMLSTAKGLDLVSYIPHERLLTETDGPFAQVYRRNALPWDVQQVIVRLATLWNMPLGEVEQKIHLNLRHLVSLL
jgi:TatD DNase family protein